MNTASLQTYISGALKVDSLPLSCCLCSLSKTKKATDLGLLLSLSLIWAILLLRMYPRCPRVLCASGMCVCFFFYFVI